MAADFALLDKVWHGLAGGTVGSTLLLALAFVLSLLLRKRLSPLQMKRFHNLQFLLLPLVFAGGFVFPAVFGSELAAECLNRLTASPLTAARVLAGAWVVCAGGWILSDLAGVALAARRSARLPRLADPRALRVLRERAEKLCPGLEIPLQLTKETVSPFAWGITRPSIVVPAFLLRASDASLGNILAHELVHVRDRDSAWSAIALLCRRALFFHPLAHLLAERHRMAQEKAADEQAVSRGGASVGGLLDSLLQVASICRPAPLNSLRLGASRGFRELKERIEALSDTRVGIGSAWRFRLAAGASLALALGCSFSQAEIAAAESSRKHDQALAKWLNLEPPLNRCQ
jgi:beta-lactamase regulating signal transducer with metallopeptidase domain